MIIDISGTVLIPGNFGLDCPGNGCNPEIECCCNECDYMLCCDDPCRQDHCASCKEFLCPRKVPQEDSR